MKKPFISISRICESKKSSILLCSLILSFTVHAQNFQWAKSGGGSSGDVANGLVVDKFGNSYVTGWFQGTATFGTTTITSAGGYDYFIAKYDGTGNLAWVKSGGGTGNDIGYSIAVDNTSQVYVTGTFSNSITFGTTTLTSTTTGNIFAVKYDNSGHVVWAQKGIGASEAQGQGIAVDDSDNAYVTGYFKGTLNLGSTSLTGGSGPGNSSIFITKLDPAGGVVWAKQDGGSGGQCNAYSIVSDPVGNTYITGYFIGSMACGSIMLTGSGLYDAYITKVDPSGNFVWAKSAGGSNIDQANGIARDTSGNLFITGYYTGTASFGSSSLTSTATSADVFLAKYRSNGTLVWVKSAGGSQADIASGIDVDDQGNAFITGYYQGTATFGTTPSLTSAGGFDIFTAKYDSGGNCKWATTAGGSSADYGYKVNARANKVYIAGSFSGTASFGSNSLTSAGLDDIYVSSITDTTYTSTSGFAKLNIENSIVCYPNPAKDNIHVQLPNAANASYCLYDMRGRQVMNGVLNVEGNINTSKLLPGTYILKIKQDDEVIKQVIAISR